MFIQKLILDSFQKHDHLELDFVNGTNVIVGGSRTGKCLTVDTIVPCPISGKLRTIADMWLEEDPKVWSINSNNKLVIGDVLAIKTNGKKDICKIKTQRGKEISCTYNHKFLTESGWIEAKNLKKDDIIACCSNIPLHKNIKEGVSLEECRIIGYMLGDGCTLHNLSFTNADKDVLKDFIFCLKKSSGNHHVRRYKKSKAITLSFSNPTNSKARGIKSCGLRKILDKYKLTSKTSNQKFIPKEFFELSNEHLGTLMGALFDCDGYIDRKNYSFLSYSTTSKQLAIDIQTLLLRLKIISSIKTKKSFYYKENKRSKIFNSYIINISDPKSVLNFHNFIVLKGFKNQLLKNKIDYINSKPNVRKFFSYDILPVELAKKIINFWRSSKFNAKTIRLACGYYPSKTYPKLANRKTTSRYFFENVAKIFNNKNISKLIFNDMLWEKIISIEYKGKENTYDIQIKKYKNFVANNIITHNSCIRRSLDWLFFNTKIDSIRKEGSKKTSVKAILSNGITLERVRSSSINRYILTVGEEKKEFDSIGKDMPEEIKEALQLPLINVDKDSINLNIANQISLPFLLDKPASFRMKLFNLLTGNDLQDKLLSLFNKSILTIGRNLKSQEENLVNYNKDLIEVSKNKEISKNYLEVFKVSYDKIKEAKLKLDKLREISDELEILTEKKEFVQFQLNKIKIVDLPDLNLLQDKITRLEKLKSLRESFLSNENKTNEVRAKINPNCLTEFNSEELVEKIKKLETLKILSEKYSKISKEKTKLTEILEEVEMEFENQELEYKKLLKEAKICPICENEIGEDCLKRIRL